jgi:hypothetical protein
LYFYNNLLVNEHVLTEQILSAVPIVRVIHIYRTNTNLDLRLEIVSVLVNLVHFMCSDVEVIRGLI